MTLEEEVHKFLKDLPPTKFFFLYFISHNLDYRSLKILAQRITDIVCINSFLFSINSHNFIKKLRPPSYATSQRDHQSRHGSQMSVVSAQTSGSARLNYSPRLRLKSISSLGPHHMLSRYHHIILSPSCNQILLTRSESSSPCPDHVKDTWILGDDEDSLPSYSKTISGPPTSRTRITTFSFDR